MTSQYVVAPIVDEEELAQLYRFRNREEVLRFVEANSFLMPLLLETRAAIRHYFGMETQAALEVIRDPEGNDGGGMLFVLIPSEEPPQAALEKLDRLDCEWWIDALASANGRMVISLE